MARACLDKAWNPSDGNVQQATTTKNEALNEKEHPKTKQKKPLPGKTKLRLEQDRKRKKNEKRTKLFATMSPDDIRQQGLIHSNLTSLDNLRIEIEKGGI